MPGQEICAPPVIVTLPAQLNAATAEQAAGQISASFTAASELSVELPTSSIILTTATAVLL